MNPSDAAFDRIDWTAALEAERRQMLMFCESLDAADWAQPSLAAGWSIKDVVAHIGSGCHAMFTPAVVRMLTSPNIEGTNDVFVEERRHWPPARVLAEYRSWSRRILPAAKIVSRSPIRHLPLRLAELGTFDARLLLCGALTFDHHTHLRHDMAPALDRPVPVTDGNRMAVVLAWMFAVLGHQLRTASPPWLDTAVGVVLSGPGGGAWMVDRTGARRGQAGGDGTWVEALAVEFPEWGTRRAHWRDRAVRIHGDEAYGAAFLDSLNIV
ncbi:maleylpyruvate isomerase N-terminal domain-containing protein [Mycolicibacterium palauense]|uniref:maleylpyruvate isomerase N-terminal domain-containing protein n=1 Tax=Mycolicibacterium palauense TaxID=2034511 RepID=UPI001FEBD85C|nr:maleylpyruvate isomerase N-terminal domain-containing protein [Mycolicibacterium palauense]